MIIIISTISQTIMPPPLWLLAILSGMGILIIIMLPWLVRLHSRLQVKLLASLKKRGK